MLPLIRIWILGVICILVTLFFVGYHISVQKEILLNNARFNLDRQVTGLAMDVDRTLFGVKQVLDGLENNLDISTAGNASPPPQVLRSFKRLVQANPFISNLGVTDATGQVVQWCNPEQSANLGARDLYSVSMEKSDSDLYIGIPRPAKNKNGAWVFGVSSAARRADGSVAYMLVALIDLNFLHQRYRDMFALPDTIMTISSPDGYVYSRIPDQDLFVGRRFEPANGMFNLVDAPLAVQDTKYVDIKDYLIITRYLGKYPLLATVSEAKETVLAPWRRDSQVAGGLGLSMSLMILLLTIQVARFHRKQVYARNSLHQQAITDPLTALYNRRYVVDQGQLEIKKAGRSGASLSFVLLDLDHFKSVNDTYGHDAGDRVLIATANTIKEICRSTDIVSRFGGEEFLMVLPDTELHGAMVIAEKIRMEMEKKIHHYAGKNFRVTASFGVSQWAENERDIREVLLRTDDALYEVKSNGRNQIRFAPAKSVSSCLPGMVSWRYAKL